MLVAARDRRAPPKARPDIVGKTPQVFDEAREREAPEGVDQGRVSVGR